MKRLGICALLAAFFLPGLGIAELGSHPDEACYLAISSEMHEKGEWLAATLGDSPNWYKPPLLYWSQRLAYQAFGKTVFAGRLPVALAAIALSLLVGSLAARIHGPRTAVPALLMTATSLGVFKFARLAMMDVPFTLALTGAVWGAWVAIEEDSPRRLLWVGVGAGAATALKGPVGILFVLMVAGGFLAWKRPRLLASRWVAIAILVGAVIALPWYVASTLRHGEAFLRSFFLHENFGKFSDPWTLSREGTLLGALLVFLLPWTLLFFGGLSWGIRSREPGALLAWLWLLSVLGVFTLPSIKFPHYVLPSLPAAILFAVRPSTHRAALRSTAVLFALVGVLVAVCLRWPLPGAAAVALVLAAVLLGFAAWSLWGGALARTAGSVGLAAVLVLVVALGAVSPPLVPDNVSAQTRGRNLAVYGVHPGLFRLALGRPVERVWDQGGLEAAVGRGTAVILTDREWKPMKDAVGSEAIEVARWPRFSRRISAELLWQSWRDQRFELLFEDVVLVAARPS